jgi:hypothetical protein
MNVWRQMGGEGKEEMMIHLSKDIHRHTHTHACPRSDSRGLEVSEGGSRASTFSITKHKNKFWKFLGWTKKWFTFWGPRSGGAWGVGWRWWHPKKIPSSSQSKKPPEVHAVILGSMFRWDMNVEKAREVFHAAHESLFAMIEQLQLPHTTVCRAVKGS